MALIGLIMQQGHLSRVAFLKKNFLCGYSNLIRKTIRKAIQKTGICYSQKTVILL